MILRIWKVSGSRGLATEILTMKSVQKCQFLAISENWTNIYACCLCKLIKDNEYFVYIHSLDFNYLCNKNWKFPFFKIWSATGKISPFVVLALCKTSKLCLKYLMNYKTHLLLTCSVIQKISSNIEILILLYTN